MLYSNKRMPRFLRSLWPLLALIAIAAAGCSKPEDAYVGHYTGKVTLSEKTLKLYGASAGKIQDMISKSKLTLDLNKDKTFASGTDSPQGKSNTTGTWTVANNDIVLTATSATMNGKSAPIPPTQQAVKFTISPDKKSLSPDLSAIPGAAANGSTMVFTKS